MGDKKVKMDDKKLTDLTVGDVGKILAWSLGIAFAIVLGLGLWFWLAG